MAFKDIDTRIGKANRVLFALNVLYRML